MKRLIFNVTLFVGFIATTVVMASANITSTRTAQFQSLSSEPIKIKFDRNLKTPLLIKGNFSVANAVSKQVAAVQFINSNRNNLGIASDHDIKMSRTYDSGNNSVVRLKQEVSGVPIFSSGIAVTVAPGNIVKTVSGKIYNINVNTTPDISKASAIQKVMSDLNNVTPSEEVTAELNVYVKSSTGLLTWHVIVKTDEPTEWHYLIDAHNSKTALKYNNIQNIKNRKTYDGEERDSLPGTLTLTENQISSGDAIVDKAHENIGIVYDYYLATHDRDSFDGNGADLISTVHHQQNYVNAFWNSTQMVYGDGDGQQYGPFGNALDIVGHEMTHAVTERTSGLIYANQPGALNESLSDVFGILIEWYHEGDEADWLQGEDCVTPGTPGDAFRYFNDPSLGDQPEHMREIYTGTGDNGGVHINSGILNFAFYKAVEVYGTSMSDMAKIYYRAQTNYLTENSDFTSAKVAYIQSAEDLFGVASQQSEAIRSGHSDVGIVDPPDDFEGTFVSSSYSTPHDYSDSQTYSKTFTSPGATGMKVKFSAFDTEAAYDLVKIIDGTGNVIYSYDGNLGAFT